MARQIFDTTVYDEATDSAYGVMALPFVGGDAPDLGTLLEELQVRAVAEFEPTKLGDAVSAVLATRHVAQTMEWLLDPPDPAGLLRPEDVSVEVTNRRDIARLREVRAASAAKSAPEDRLQVIREKPTEITKADAAAVRAFTNAGVGETLVPLQRSPVDLHPFLELSEEAYRTLIVTPRSNPLVLVYDLAVCLVIYSVVSLVRAHVGGIAVGVRYRAMKNHGVPDDIIRAQMSVPPADGHDHDGQQDGG